VPSRGFGSAFRDSQMSHWREWKHGLNPRDHLDSAPTRSDRCDQLPRSPDSEKPAGPGGQPGFSWRSGQNVKYTSIAEPAPPSIYRSSEQWIYRRLTVVVRTAVENAESLDPAIQRETESMDPMLTADFAVYTPMSARRRARDVDPRKSRAEN
jgi:hypothetical protein